MRKVFILLFIIILVVPLSMGNPMNTFTGILSNNIAKAATVNSEAPNSYKMIRSALLKNEKMGQFDTSELTYKEVGKLIQQVARENPEILYYQSAITWSDGKIEFSYVIPIDSAQKNAAALSKEMNKVLAIVNKSGSTDFDKVKAIHDYIVLNVAYDYDNLLNNTVPADSYTAYGALIKGVAVCEGYTKAAQLLMDRLGIENYYVEGSGNGGLHAWNLVKLNGHYYSMDITWDDPVPNVEGVVSYKYFLVSSDQLRKDHKWNEAGFPVAKSKKYNYFNDFSSLVEAKGHYYYSSLSDKHTLYRITKDGKAKKKVNNVRAPYFDIAGDWIYFSNYSMSGHLHKMKLDGSNLQSLNTIPSTNVSVIGNSVQFMDSKTKKVHTLSVK
ncbi:DUF5050 domain-containing protein [Sporosarcina limicola]|uniref:Transglutaminase-like domain-containing protein n=1 Tax=Sporosarcina limicola TaxID=34101 RepID=A0A927ML63_9BACL|nr:DUF5050 domain-containing protein [Sporosarcina limicola]MBE1556628.1 hypothetical protein [Sporosarcina limicola]